MLSFSFDTEVLSLFWGLLGTSQRHQSGIDLIQITPGSSTSEFLPVLAGPTSPFLQLLVFPTKSDASLNSYLQYSVLTAGVLTIVGISSYCAYSVLTMAREKLVADGFIKVNSNEVDTGVLPSMKLSQKSPPSRPDSLIISHAPSRRCGRIGGRGVFTRRMLSGDETEEEDDLEAEPEYFGPILVMSENENDDELEEAELMFPVGDFPVSPSDSAYTSEYETAPRPLHLRLDDNDHEL